MNIRIAFFCFVFSLYAASATYAQKSVAPAKISRVLFVFDASNSMHSMWNSEKRITVARKLLSDLVDSLEKVPNTEMALRVYGHQSYVPPQDCNDTKLEVQFAKKNAQAIKQKLRWIDPKGTTPIARSLEVCAADFPPDPNARNIIILITDGIEACDGDPCAVSRALQAKGIVLKPFVIGIGLDKEFLSTFSCVGKVFNAFEETQLREALNMAISQALFSTTVQINLLDTQKKPTETNVPITFYDKYSGQIKHNYVHTLNAYGRPDTIVLDPLVTYRMVAHTLPPQVLPDMELEPGVHTVFSLNAPQGEIQLKHPGGHLDKHLKFIVKKKGSHEIVNVQLAEDTEKYICGLYDIEVLTLPRTRLSVDVTQSKLSVLRVPQPGLLNIYKTIPGNGALFVERKNELEFVVSLDESSNRTDSYILQPGTYRLVYRVVGSKQTLHTIERRFTIASGAVEHVRLN
jgi:Ca-activated chloride channel homolog